MDLDTQTNVIRQLEAELWKLMRFSVAILNFEFLGGNIWRPVGASQVIAVHSYV